MYLVSRNVKQITCHHVRKSPVYDEPFRKEDKGLVCFDKTNINSLAGHAGHAGLPSKTSLSLFVSQSFRLSVSSSLMPLFIKPVEKFQLLPEWKRSGLYLVAEFDDLR